MKNKALINFSIIPKDDPKQALRIRRFFMAFGAYALWSFLVISLIWRDSWNGKLLPDC